MSKNELYQYENLLKIYKNCIKKIRDNPKLSDKDKKERIAILSEQIASLKKSYRDKIGPKEKYDRAKDLKNNDFRKDYQEYVDR